MRESLPWSAYAPLVPGLVFLALFLVVPLGATLWLSLSPNVLVRFEAPGLDNFAYLLGKAYYLDVLMRTVRIAAVTTAIALLIGYPAAYVLRDVSERLGSTMIIGLTFPILAGPLVVVLGWMILLSDGGPLIRPLVRLGLTGPLRLLGTETAIVVGLVHFTLPFVVLTLFAVLKEIPHDLLEAARSLGAGRIQVMRRVVWPLSLPGVVSAALIAFSLAASSYVSPHYLGGATQLTLTTLVAQFILATFNSELAAAAATMLLVVMAVVIFGFTKATARAVRA
ncbi:MAG: ABC transporter permease [Proteobacteria bacterium]|nr:ABC transporter permease [Pseudomonadota bacterium]